MRYDGLVGQAQGKPVSGRRMERRLLPVNILDPPPFFALPSFPAYCIITQTEGLVRSELWNFGFSAHHAARSSRRRRNTPGGWLVARIAASGSPFCNLRQSCRLPKPLPAPFLLPAG